MVKMKQLWKDEQGGAMILLVFIVSITVAFAALAVDIGRVYFQKEALNDKLDAIALAAVQDLWISEAAARLTGERYALKNGVDRPQIAPNQSARTVTVTAVQKVPLYFARLLGFETMDVNGRAVAQAGMTSAGEGFLPLGVVDQPFIYNKSYVLKYGPGGSMQGNFGALALGGQGASNYRDNLINGYKGLLKIGKDVNTEPGNMQGPTDSGLSYRLFLDSDRPSCNSFDTADRSCARFLYIPVINTLDVNGRKTVTIVGFAAFYLESLHPANGNNMSQVTGRFVQSIYPGEFTNTISKYGLMSVKLID